ncbi:MAG: EMC3/TMCO1 family protein [Nanoarchaeota archaeon]
MVFESILDPVFRPLLGLNPLFAILLLSLGITFIVTIVYKLTTNQAEMKRLKKEMKDLQKQLKELAKTDPKKAMSVQKKAMEKNFSYMKHSLKPTLYTFLPIIIIFGWLNSNMAYQPLLPGEPFEVKAVFDKYLILNVTLEANPELTFLNEQAQPLQQGIASWNLSGEAGKYQLTLKDGTREYTKKILISSEKRYENPVEMYKSAPLKQVIIGNNRIRPFGDWFNILGWHPGWLATYILSSMLFSILLRKAMNLA